MNSFKPPHDSRLSNRFFEKKFQFEYPQLTDYHTIHDVVALVNHHRERVGGGDKLIPANEIIRFDHRICGLGSALPNYASEHEDPLGDLGARSGYGAEAIHFAASGRLLPETVCAEIVAAAGLPNLKIEHVMPGSLGTPLGDPVALRAVLTKLAA